MVFFDKVGINLEELRLVENYYYGRKFNHFYPVLKGTIDFPKYRTIYNFSTLIIISTLNQTKFKTYYKAI